MLKSAIVLFFLLVTLITQVADAQINEESPANTITSVNVEEIPAREFSNLVANPIGEITIIIDGLLAIGKKIWPIIEAGRPVITNKTIPAISILPNLENPAGVMLQMANWSMPKTRSYRISFKNGLGIEVVGFNYTLIFQYNGDLNGVGKYVTNLKVQASDIYAAWGFNFDAVTEMIGIANVGTKEGPIASGIIQVAYTVRGKINEKRSAQSFYVDGTGNIELLNN